MTDMRRITVSIPDELDQMVLDMRKNERYARCSYSEIVRQMLEIGFASIAQEPQTSA